jgi:hypothetical protein
MAEVSVSSASWSCKLLALLPIMIREALRRLGQGRQKERKWGDPRKLFARRCGTSLSLVPGWRFITVAKGKAAINRTAHPRPFGFQAATPNNASALWCLAIRPPSFLRPPS